MIVNRSTLPLYLTKEVIAALYVTGNDEVIYMADNEGGVIVGLAEHIGEEGTGVWIDAGGIERYGTFGGGDQEWTTSESARLGYEKLDRIPDLYTDEKPGKKQAKYMKKQGKKIQKKAAKKAKMKDLPPTVTGASHMEVPLQEVSATLATVIPPEAQAAIMEDLKAQQPVDLKPKRLSRRKK